MHSKIRYSHSTRAESNFPDQKLALFGGWNFIASITQVKFHPYRWEYLRLTSTAHCCTNILMEKASQVWITKFAEKQLKKLPNHILAAYRTWVGTVEIDGIRKTRKLPGYHDEPLKGDRKGQRSVRLGRSYRIIYEETETGNLVLIGVQEVNKHEY